MQRTKISELYSSNPGSLVRIAGWVERVRKHSKARFIDVTDGSGEVQVVIPADVWQSAEGGLLSLEAAIVVTGVLQEGSEKNIELLARSVVVSGSSNPLPIAVRTDRDSALQHEYSWTHRHLTIRSPRVAGIQYFRAQLLSSFRRWFDAADFVELNPPLITESLLYADSASLPFELDYFGRQAFLSQCTAFYLEAALPAFDSVFAISPTFRRESGHSRRHLVEYWHVKGERAFCGRDDVMQDVEQLLRSAISDTLNTVSQHRIFASAVPLAGGAVFDAPYERIPWKEAISRSQLPSRRSPRAHLQSCVDDIGRPTWIVDPPSQSEPFPYVRRLDGTVAAADLYFPGGIGEVAGCADKETDYQRLKERLQAQNKGDYDWYLDLRTFGCPEHAGFGLGLERIIRAALGLTHVAEAALFPRVARHRPSP